MTIFGLILSFFSLKLYAQDAAELQRSYVNRYEDFISHTKIHISFVIRLSIYGFQTHSNNFTSVKIQNLTDKIKLHDAEKIMSIAELREFGYSHKRTLGQRLYEFYNKPQNAWKESEQNEMDEIKREMERIGYLIEMRFFESRGLLLWDGSLSEEAKSIKFIEHIADLVEREMNLISREEFAKKMRNATQMLDSKLARTIAVYLRRNYDRINSNNPLILLKSNVHINTRSCSKLFNFN